MKILYLDLSMGVAGDMLMGALVSLLDEKGQQKFLQELKDAGIPGVTVNIFDDKKCGIVGKHVEVKINGKTEVSHDIHVHRDEHECHDEHHHEHENYNEHEYHHEHGNHNEHEHHHEHEQHDGHEHPCEHHHASMSNITDIINGLKVSNSVKREIKSVYKRIANAESKVHGTDVTDIHFHEVGMMDALADITGCAMLFEMLDADEIAASSINTGYGQVKCAHGILPVPAPATALLLCDIPCYSGSIEGELCTPTGAALIGNYVSQFCGMPFMKIDNIGYGTGSKDFAAANVVRAILGENVSLEEGDFDTGNGEKENCEKNNSDDTLEDKIVEMNCNLDDMTGEEIGYVTELLMEGGAKDVYTIPITAKKGRTGVILGMLCKPEDRKRLAEIIFKHTTTIGIRYTEKKRMILERHSEVVHTQYGDINVKISEGYGAKKIKPEYEDLKRIAGEKNIAFQDIRENIYKINNQK